MKIAKNQRPGKSYLIIRKESNNRVMEVFTTPGQVNLRPDKTTAICFKMWYAHIVDEKNL